MRWNAPGGRRFPSREQHFTLRRELAPYFADGNQAETARAAAKTLRGRASKKRCAAAVNNLNIPASLTVGRGIYAETRGRSVC